MKYAVTNIRIEADMLRSIKLRALERGVPASAIIREALKEYLKEPEMTDAEWERDRAELMKFCGIGRSKGGKGKGTGSTDIDEVLYGPRLYRKKRK